MQLPLIRNSRCAALLAALLGCVSAPAQETALEPVVLPPAARPLPAPAESGAATGPAAAEGTEEVIVQGRSLALLREELEIAENKLYAVFNDINTIEEFDIHCALHAQTGTRMPQRVCLPNYVKRAEEREAQAFRRALSGEGSYDLDWQTPTAEMSHKTNELQEHMQRLAIENPELLEAMREMYGIMQTLYPRRYADEGNAGDASRSD
jgi:hypothetical protein